MAADDDLRDLARDLRKTAEGKVLVKEMLKRLRATARTEVTPATRARALAILPRSGGLANRVAKSPQRVTARAGATSATVAVTVPGKTKGSGAAAADRGSIRHPVFGNPAVFVTQNVPSGWFTEPAEAAGPAVVQDALKAMDETARAAGFK